MRERDLEEEPETPKSRGARSWVVFVLIGLLLVTDLHYALTPPGALRFKSLVASVWSGLWDMAAVCSDFWRHIIHHPWGQSA